MRSPYPSIALSFHALNAIAIGYIAFYRAELYRLPASTLVLCAALGVVGLLAPPFLLPPVRGRLLAGIWPLVLILPFIALLLGPVLVPSPLTVGPFFFCAGASLATCVLVWSNVTRRRRSLRRLLQAGEHGDETLVRAQLARYLATEEALAEDELRKAKELHRALRAQAWHPSPERRSRAAAALRAYADTLDAAWRSPHVRVPDERLRPLAEANQAAHQQVAAAFRRGADELERGERRFRWRSWLIALSSAAFEAERDLLFAVELLAKRHGLARPESLRRVRRALGSLPLTASDVAPPSSRDRLAKPATAAVAVLVLASSLVATATATATAPPPWPDDDRPLPVIGGPSAESRVDPRFSRIASALADRRAEVRCWSTANWDEITAKWARWPNAPSLGAWSAYTSRDRERVHLSPAICDSLERLRDQRHPVEDGAWSYALAWSAAALAHEAQHVRGIGNEAKAECYGVQTIVAVARALGRTRGEGKYLASLYWQRRYLKRRNPEYVSDECRDRGELDLRPETAIWP